MRTKLPQDAFAYYASLGPNRSYAAVANYFQVDKTTVVRHAKRDRWQAQIVDAEKKAQTRTQEKLVTTLDEMNDRHLKVLRAVLGKALEALRATPLRSASEAVRAIDMCVKHERVILGEPGERTAINIEEVIRREYDRWLVRPGGDGVTDDAPSSASSACARREGFDPSLVAIGDHVAPTKTHDGPEDEDDDELA